MPSDPGNVTASLAAQLTKCMHDLDSLAAKIGRLPTTCPHWDRSKGGCLKAVHHLMEEMEFYSSVPVVETAPAVCAAPDCSPDTAPVVVRISTQWLCPRHAREYARQLLAAARRAETIERQLRRREAISSAGTP